MSTSRHLPLWACLHVLTLSCASRPELAPPQPATYAASHWVAEPESPARDPRSPEPRAANPYAPTRSTDPALYFWRSETPTECSPEPRAAEPDAEHALEPRPAGDLLAAIPERSSGAASDARPISAELVVAGLRPALHHCFSRWLDDQFDAQGSARFALELDCEGGVEAISAENQGVDESALSCLFSALGPARFAPPPAGHATVLVPVMFRNAH